MAECCICCSSVTEQSEMGEASDEVVEETYTVATKCGHLFHNNCLHRWLKTKRVCPSCKTRVPSGAGGVIRIFTSDGVVGGDGSLDAAASAPRMRTRRRCASASPDAALHAFAVRVRPPRE